MEGELNPLNELKCARLFINYTLVVNLRIKDIISINAFYTIQKNIIE